MTEVKQNNIDRILLKLYGRSSIRLYSDNEVDADYADFYDYVEYISDKRV